MNQGPQLLFLDTEFTSLGEPWPVQLVSIGVCDINGVSVYYREVNDFNMWYASFFTQEYVLPHCTGGDDAMSYATLCSHFLTFFKDFCPSCVFVADSEWDGLWLQMICKHQQNMDGFAACLDSRDLRQWPASVLTSMEVLDLDQLNDDDIEFCRKEHKKRLVPLREHHALDDAIGLAHCAKTLLSKYGATYTLSELRKVFKSHAMPLN